MKKTRRPINGKTGATMKSITGVLWGVAILLAGSAIIAWIISSEMLAMEDIAYGVVIILLVASFVSSLIAMSGREIAWKSLLIHAVGIVASLLLGNQVMGIGRVEGILPTALVVFGGCGCALLLKLTPKKTKSYARRK